MNEAELRELQLVRVHRQRRDGAEYKLRVIPNSGGMLELVEQRPREHWFVEWARAMQYSGWGY